MESVTSYVVKVQSSGTIRRLTLAKGDGEFSYDQLQGRIRDLFQLPASAQFGLTYVDKDGDVVTMAEDADLKDALVLQALNPLRVTLENVQQQTGPPILKAKDENPDEVNEQQTVQRELIHPSLSKSALEEKVEPSDGSSGDKNSPLPAGNKGSKIDAVRDGSPGSEATSVDAVKEASPPAEGAPESNTEEEEAPIAEDQFHFGIQCDGCYMLPITGPRFVARSTPNYDLCLKCYESSGAEESEYARIERRTSECAAHFGRMGQRMGGKPDQRTCGKPDQRMCWKPDQRTGGKPDQRMGGKPDQRMGGKPDQRMGGKPDQRMGGKPDQRTGGKPDQRMGGKPDQRMGGKPDQRMCWKPDQRMCAKPPQPSANRTPEAAKEAEDENSTIALTVHAGVQCDECGMEPLEGPRFKSTTRFNYDLCQSCHDKSGRAGPSPFWRIDQPVLRPGGKLAHFLPRPDPSGRLSLPGHWVWVLNHLVPVVGINQAEAEEKAPAATQGTAAGDGAEGTPDGAADATDAPIPALEQEVPTESEPAVDVNGGIDQIPTVISTKEPKSGFSSGSATEHVGQVSTDNKVSSENTELGETSGAQETVPAEAPASAAEGDVPTKEGLLAKLAAMGFDDPLLNEEILEKNNSDLRRTVDDLCAAEEWDPILGELQEMGFYDANMNRRLMFKNNGSVKRVVKELVQMYKAENAKA